MMSSSGTRRSFTSEGSQSEYGSELEELSDEELVKAVTKLREQVRIMKLENEIVEKTIIRLDPALMHGVYQAYDYATKRHSTSSVAAGSLNKSTCASKFGLMESLLCPSRMFANPSRMNYRKVDSSGRLTSGYYPSGPKINLNEMMEIVATETNIVISNQEKATDRSMKKQVLLKAQMEEIEIRVADIEDARKQFEKEVIKEGFDHIAQRIPAEKWIRFMAEYDKKTDKQIGRLRLRTSTLNIQFNKLQSQIKIKAELSERLRPVDFEVIRINNEQCLKKLEQKLQQLDELKAITGDANLNLVIHKKTMLSQNYYLNAVQKLTKTKERLADELDAESDTIQLQTNIITERLNKIKKTRMTYQVPDVMEYVNMKGKITDLRRSIKRLQQKVHIAHLTQVRPNPKLEVIKDETGSTSTLEVDFTE